MRVRHRLVALVGGVALALALGGARAEASIKLAAQVTGFDVLTRPGVAALVQVKVALRDPFGLQPTMKGRTVKLWRGSTYLGSATTAGEGLASFWYVPTGVGYTILSAQVSSSILEGNTARIVVGSFPATTRFVVTDIDKTIAQTNELSFLFSSNPADTGTLPYAPEVLRRANARGWQVLYVTARDHRFAVKTKDWLALKGFPVGCSFYMDVNLVNVWSPDRYKSETIRRLKTGFPNLRVGCGNTPTDATAYLANGLTALILPVRDTFSNPATPLPAGSTPVANWLVIERYLP
ncbi:MAG: hypothetical protein HZA54_13615 [Planctomycetes bacterium]|nr:hypothetical protein [Planctomycetota bacterium]